jgi:hypothetical protein
MAIVLNGVDAFVFAPRDGADVISDFTPRT